MAQIAVVEFPGKAKIFETPDRKKLCSMVNPGAFRGLRKEFLVGEKQNYAAAMEGGYGADTLAQIQRRYFKRFPVELGHFEEPSPEHLAAVDDDAPDPEPEEPDAEKLTSEEFETATKKAEHRQKVIRYRKAQIKRWMAYRYMKDQDLDPKDSGANNPFHSLIFTITGKEIGRPRRRIPVNVWRKTQREAIEAKLKVLAESEGITKDRLASYRDKIARDMFNELPASEQEHWKEQANIESTFALEDWKRKMLGDPPTAADDYQIAIQGIVCISKPFLDFLCKATGWKATLIAGGPEPAQDGKLNVISVHSGETPGAMKLNWGRALCSPFKKDVISCFGDFLKMCYTPEECRARALSLTEGYAGLVEEECDQEGVDHDTVDLMSPAASATAPTAPAKGILSNITNTMSRSTGIGIPGNHARHQTVSSSNTLNVSKTYNISGQVNTSLAPRKPFPFDQVTKDQTGLYQAAATQPRSSLAKDRTLRKRTYRHIHVRWSEHPLNHATQDPSATHLPSRLLFPYSCSISLYKPPSCSPTPPRPCNATPFDSPHSDYGHFNEPHLLSPDPSYSPPPTTVTPYQEPLGIAESSTERNRGRPAKQGEGPTANGDAKEGSQGGATVLGKSSDKAALTASRQRPTKGRKKKAGSSVPIRKSSRCAGEKRKATDTASAEGTDMPKPKKRRKSTGTWIVEDSEGGWRDQDGNACEPPSQYNGLY